MDSPRPLPPLPARLKPEQLTADLFQGQLSQIRTYAAEHALLAVSASNPWRFVSKPAWSFEREQQLLALVPRLRTDVLALSERMEALRSSGLPLASASWEGTEQLVDAIGQLVGRSVPSVVLDAQRWPGVNQAARRWLQQEQELARQEQDLRSRWQPAAFEAELEPLIARLQQLLGSFVLLRWIAAFLFRRKLRPLVRQPALGLRRILEDLRTIRDHHQQRQQLEQERHSLQQQLSGWSGEQNALTEHLKEWEDLAAQAEASPGNLPLLLHVAGWTEARTTELLAVHRRVTQGFEALATQLNLDAFPLAAQCAAPLAQLAPWFQQLEDNLPDLRSWTLAYELERDFRSTGPAAVLDWGTEAAIPLAELEEAYRTAVLRHWFQRLFDADPALSRFSASRHNNLVDQFRARDQEVQQLSRRYVRARVISRMPNRQLNINGSELAELNREFAKKKGRLPLRTLFSRIPTLLPKLKPCLLASPISVSRFLPADGQRFDIVIFDEASQVETHHAIAAIGRGEQVVIVGDNKQMPPSSFFQRPATGDDGVRTNDGIDDLESILDEAIACGLPQQMLQWHYRSRHEALIAFSNTSYYSSCLNIFPAPCRSDSELGIHWHPVQDGVYKPGARTNEREARALVDLLLQRLRAHRPGERSFGVITFSIPQQLLIEGLLQQACEQEPDLDDWFSRDNLDYCFIKNLETVQGDERDEIFFSICFAPRPNGVLSMDFGALNKLGGERRLNVAITRARCAMHVVTSLQPEQIDRSRTNALAVHQLQDYLFFCRNQQRLAERPLRAGDFDGSLQRQIHELLTSEGYQVDCKVGCANYRIDLAVVDPQQPSHYRIGIECDGAAYAAAATVRDRDRLRTAVLEQLGWTMHRVWALEWQLNPASERQRLLEAVRRACAGPGPGVVAAKASLARPITPLRPAPPLPLPPQPTPPTAAEPNPSAEAAARLATPYRQASLERVSNEFREFHGNQATTLIVNRLLALVGVEAPILLREATLRVTQCWNSRAFSQKAHDRLLVVAQNLHRQQRLFLDHEDTLWSSRQQSEEWIEFRLPLPTGRAIDTVPMAERRAALLVITREALTMDGEALLREACLQLTGGSRFTQQQRSAIASALDQLLQQGLLTERDGRIHIPADAS